MKKLNFNKIFNNSGYVINVNKDGYGKSYDSIERSGIYVEEGDYFIISDYCDSQKTVLLIKIDFKLENNHTRLLEEISDKNDELKRSPIFDYINLYIRKR